MTVESAGFSGRLPKAITFFLCSMDGYFEVDGARIKTCQAVVFGVAIVLNEEYLCMCVQTSEGVGCMLTVALALFNDRKSGSQK